MHAGRHRLTTICNCDKNVVMGDDGTKVEEGTHEELLQVPKQVDEEGEPVVGPGLYHTLWDTQQVGSEGSGKSDDETEKLEEQMQEQQTKIEMQQQKMDEQQQQIEALSRELNWLQAQAKEAVKESKEGQTKSDISMIDIK